MRAVSAPVVLQFRDLSLEHSSFVADLDKKMGNSYERPQKFLIFHSSGVDCAFRLDAVREIVPMAMLFSPLGLPSGLAGFLDLRGTAIPILRLDRLFDLPEQQPGLYTPIIVLHGIRAPIGILVASVRGIMPVAAGELLKVPPQHTFRGCATAAIQISHDVIHVLSPAALLDVNEGRLLAEYSAMSQARLLEMGGKT